MLAQHGINRELTVRLDRNFVIDSLSILNNPQQSQQTVAPNPSNPTHGRRASVAGSNLYSVNSRIVETGYDFLGRIPRSNRVMIGEATTTDSGSTTAMATTATTSVNSVNYGATTSRGTTLTHPGPSHRRYDSSDKSGNDGDDINLGEDRKGADGANKDSKDDDKNAKDFFLDFLYDSDESGSLTYESDSDFGDEIQSLFAESVRPHGTNYLPDDFVLQSLAIEPIESIEIDYFTHIDDLDLPNLFLELPELAAIDEPAVMDEPIELIEEYIDDWDLPNLFLEEVQPNVDAVDAVVPQMQFSNNHCHFRI